MDQYIKGKIAGYKEGFIQGFAKGIEVRGKILAVKVPKKFGCSDCKFKHRNFCAHPYNNGRDIKPWKSRLKLLSSNPKDRHPPRWCQLRRSK